MCLDRELAPTVSAVRELVRAGVRVSVDTMHAPVVRALVRMGFAVPVRIVVRASV
ncbi:hypothetical protein ACWCQQ_47090 [Streptomyces sp. NPDC002143]